MKISEHHDEIWKNRTFLAFLLLKTLQKIDEKLLKYRGLSGAKACTFRRSRQELSNEYSFSKIRFDIAENEPLKVCQKIAKS